MATGRRYGSFAGRVEFVAPEIIAATAGGGGGGSGSYYGDPLDTAFGRKTEEFELMLLIEAALVVMEDT